VTAASGAQARARADSVAHDVLAGYALDEPGRARVSVESRCAAACRDGFGRGAEVEVTVSYRVDVLGPLAGLLGVDLPVRAVHRTRVDRFRGL
jgi:hypothetical protein